MQGKKTKHITMNGLEYKFCSRCGELKVLDNFYASKITSDGFRSACIACENLENENNYAKNREKEIARARKWQAENPEKVRDIDRNRNKAKRKEWRKEWSNKNPEKVKQYAFDNYQKLKAIGHFREYQKKWRELINREKYLEWVRRNTVKRSLTVKGVIDHRMNTALRMALWGNKQNHRWNDLVGYSTSELIRRLSETMPQGYSWDRIGELHIDHIIPKSFFQYGSMDDSQFQACWGLDNLQLLPAEENLKKGNKLIKTGG